uniref:Uncharacterized protein n=1 Tax=Anopheles melas TaxID=34690 RepID=A0A182TRB3_9DIPT
MPPELPGGPSPPGPPFAREPLDIRGWAGEGASASDTASLLLQVIVIIGGSNGRSSEVGFSHCFRNLERREKEVYGEDVESIVDYAHQQQPKLAGKFEPCLLAATYRFWCCCRLDPPPASMVASSVWLARWGGGDPGITTTAVRSLVGLGCCITSCGMMRSRGRSGLLRSGVGGWMSIAMIGTPKPSGPSPVGSLSGGEEDE